MPHMKSERRERLFKELKNALAARNSTYIVEFADNKTCKIQAYCVACNTFYVRDKCQIFKYDCICQRVNNITNTHSKKSNDISSKLIHKLKTRNIEVTYKGQNQNQKVECYCTICYNKWYAFLGNLRKGSGCPRCNYNDPIRIGKTTSKKVRQKRRDTMIKRYGTEHALQNKVLFDKNIISSYKYVNFVLGENTVKVQGYEPKALLYLVDIMGAKPESIVCGVGSKIPCIKFNHKEKSSVYHPDIFIPNSNLIIEVKSAFTFDYSKDLNLAKRKACLLNGYKFMFMVMNKNGTLNHEYNRFNYRG